MTTPTAGAKFKQALADEKPLQIVGTINANHALLAKRAGYRAIYLSGGGVAAGRRDRHRHRYRPGAQAGAADAQ